MISELAFLVELVVDHKLPKITKEVIRERIKDLTAGNQMPTQQPQRSVVVPAALAGQAPSTIAAMMRHATEGQTQPPTINIAAQEPSVGPVQQIAQTPATAAALAQRQQMINEAVSGQVAVTEKGKMTTRGARKF